jgi:hypothetical protein
MDPLDDVPRVELVAGVEAAQLLAVLVGQAEGRVPVAVPAAAHMEVDQVSDRERAFHHGRRGRAHFYVLPPEDLGSLAVLRLVQPPDLIELLVVVQRRPVGRVLRTVTRLAPLGVHVPMQLARYDLPGLVPPRLVIGDDHGAAGVLRHLLLHVDHDGPPVQHVAGTDGTVVGRLVAGMEELDAPQGLARLSVQILGDDRVAVEAHGPLESGRAYLRTPSGALPVLAGRIERVVVAVTLGEVPDGVVGRLRVPGQGHVPGSHRGVGIADAPAHQLDRLISDLAEDHLVADLQNASSAPGLARPARPRSNSRDLYSVLYRAERRQSTRVTAWSRDTT